MSKDYPVQGPSIATVRERAVEVLMEHFSRDVMDLEEFEGLLDAVNRCSTVGELRELLSKLPPVESSEPATDMIPARGGAPVVVDADRVRPHGFLISILGATNRSGRWIPARKSFALVLTVVHRLRNQRGEVQLVDLVDDLRIGAGCGGESSRRNRFHDPLISGYRSNHPVWRGIIAHRFGVNSLKGALAQAENNSVRTSTPLAAKRAWSAHVTLVNSIRSRSRWHPTPRGSGRSWAAPMRASSWSICWSTRTWRPAMGSRA